MITAGSCNQRSVEMGRITLSMLIIWTFVFIGCSVSDISGLDGPPIEPDLPGTEKRGLEAFKSEAELKEFLATITRKRNDRLAKDSGSSQNTAASSPVAQESKNAAADGESVTNVQHAGVDEGGIIKVHGEHLVILRRGRLFTVRTGDDTLSPVSAIDAFGPDIDPSGTWYDEMLISGDRIVVVGYSYQRGGTEIGLFRIGRGGELAYESTYHLRSNDYYSSRNYASRLIGQKLIFYTPSYIRTDEHGFANSLPAMRKWRRGATAADFRTIAPINRIYRGVMNGESMYYPALHSVTICDLSRAEVECSSTSLVGPPGNVFYVSPTSVYVWTASWEQGESRSIVYRMPLDGSGPTAMGAYGSPTDQFSFLESDDGRLNVLLRSHSSGNWMWGAENSKGRIALLRLPISAFADGRELAAKEFYTVLPEPEGYSMQNRFVGDFVLYATGSGWRRPVNGIRSKVYAANWRSGSVSELDVPHGVDRIEALGRNAIAIGTDGRDLHFSGIRLGSEPTIDGKFVYAGGTQGETRSHGFFYKPDGNDSGVLGLPVRGSGQPGYKHLVEGSASVLFIRNDAMRFREVGELMAEKVRSVNDGCRASCVDWYGNARPLFLKGRIFALMGYEIVEARMQNGALSERRRIDYSRSIAGRGSSGWE